MGRPIKVRPFGVIVAEVLGPLICEAIEHQPRPTVCTGRVLRTVDARTICDHQQMLLDDEAELRYKENRSRSLAQMVQDGLPRLDVKPIVRVPHEPRYFYSRANRSRVIVKRRFKQRWSVA